MVRSLGMSKLEAGAPISEAAPNIGSFRHLIMFVSKPDGEPTWTEDGRVLLAKKGQEPMELRRADEAVPLSAARMREIAKASGSANWHQAIRAVAPHRENLEGIWLIGSGGDTTSASSETAGVDSHAPNDASNPDQVGSFGSLPILKRLLGVFVPEKLVDFYRPPYGSGVDFADISQLLQVVRSVIREIRTRDSTVELSEIVVECTSGLKTASIAGAVITLGDGVRFQYVAGDGTVYLHDLRFDEGPSFG
jgi:hypothetical protein